MRRHSSLTLIGVLALIIIPVTVWSLNHPTNFRSSAKTPVTPPVVSPYPGSPFANAAIFSGREFFYLPNGQTLPSLNTDFTIELRLLLNPQVQFDNAQYILVKSNYHLMQTPTNQTGSGPIIFSLKSTPNMFIDLQSTTNLKADGLTWYHIAIVRQGLNLSLYLNGQLEASKELITMAIPSEDTPLILGANADLHSDIFNPLWGQVDEVRISSTPRYTGNFIPPTQPFTSDSTTGLLLHLDGNTKDFSPLNQPAIPFGNLQFTFYPTWPDNGHCPALNYPSYMTFYGYIYLNNQTAPKNTLIRFFSPRNELVGCGVVNTDQGTFPFTRVFSNDQIDHFLGMNDGEPITIMVNDELATSNPSPIIFNSTGNLHLTLFGHDFSPTPPISGPGVDLDHDNDTDFIDLNLFVREFTHIFDFNRFFSFFSLP